MNATNEHFDADHIHTTPEGRHFRHGDGVEVDSEGNATTTERKVTIRAKAFSGEGVRTHRVLVDGSTVRVWDAVAGHYTTCHCLSRAAVKRAIAAAK